MILPEFDALPAEMKNEEVKYYYDILSHKKIDLFFKRFFDMVFSIILIIILAIPMLVVAALVKKSSPGPVF